MRLLTNFIFTERRQAAWLRCLPHDDEIGGGLAAVAPITIRAKFVEYIADIINVPLPYPKAWEKLQELDDIESKAVYLVDLKASDSLLEKIEELRTDLKLELWGKSCFRCTLSSSTSPPKVASPTRFNPTRAWKDPFRINAEVAEWRRHIKSTTQRREYSLQFLPRKLVNIDTAEQEMLLRFQAEFRTGILPANSHQLPADARIVLKKYLSDFQMQRSETRAQLMGTKAAERISTDPRNIRKWRHQLRNLQRAVIEGLERIFAFVGALIDLAEARDEIEQQSAPLFEIGPTTENQSPSMRRVSSTPSQARAPGLCPAARFSEPAPAQLCAIPAKRIQRRVVA